MVEQIRQGDIPGVQLRCRRRLSIPAEMAWRWLDPDEGLDRWLCSEAEALDQVGAWRLRTEKPSGPPVVEGLVILDSTPPHRLILAFKQHDPDWPVATRLTFELWDTADGCELSVFQEGFEHLPLSDCLTHWEEYRRRWRRCLDRLAAAVS